MDIYMDDRDSILVNYNFRCTGIIVIQSLPENEHATGKELFDDIISRYSEMVGFESHYREVYDREDFFQQMEHLIDAVLKKGHFPILHFEVHGSNSGNGLILASGQLVTWEELGEYCRRINVYLRNELTISLATCKGAQFYHSVDFSKPAAFWGYLGPRDVIYNSELLRDFTAFYETFLRERDLAPAIETLNFFDDDCKYVLLTSEMLFDRLMELADETPIDVSKYTRQQRRALKDNEDHPLSGEKYWKKRRRKFLMQ